MTSSGTLSLQNLQVFIGANGFAFEEASQLLFRRFCPYSVPFLDINDLRRIILLYGSPLPANIRSAQSEEVTNSKPKSSLRRFPGDSPKDPKAKIKDLHKTRRFKCTVTSNVQKMNFTAYSDEYVTLEQELREERVLLNDQRKEALLKPYSHDSKLLEKNMKHKRGYYIMGLLKTLHAIAQTQVNVRRKKNDICMQEDFSVLNLFLHFDSKQKGKLSLAEFRNGLAKFGIYPHKLDACLLLKTFDRKSTGYLSFESFYRMVIPEGSEFKKSMESRQLPVKADYLSSICEETFGILKSLFVTLIEKSVEVECLKQRFVQTVGGDLNECYLCIPKKHSRYIKEDEVGDG